MGKKVFVDANIFLEIFLELIKALISKLNLCYPRFGRKPMQSLCLCVPFYFFAGLLIIKDLSTAIAHFRRIFPYNKSV